MYFSNHFNSHFMKTYVSTFIVIFLLLFQNINFAQITKEQEQENKQTLEDDKKEIDAIIEEVLKPTKKKLGLLGLQKTSKQTIIIACNMGLITVPYNKILNKSYSHKDLKELFIKKLLPNYTKTGEALNTVYDKYLMKEIETYVEYSEVIPKFGLTLITEHELADVYIAPEKGENPKDTGMSLEEGLESNGVEKNTVLNRYGDIIGTEFNAFEKLLKDNNLDAIVEMTNFYEKFNLENVEEYNQYLDALLEIYNKELGKAKDPD